MVFVILCILSVIFLFFITITLLKMRETWIYETTRKPLSQKYRDIQGEFRGLISPLERDNIINGTTKQRLTTIATNFFVFQPLNEDNITRLVLVADSCKGIFEQCLQVNSEYPDQLPEVFQRFIDSIPISARDFDADFYDYVLPDAFEALSFSIQTLSKNPLYEEINEKVDDEDNEEFDIFKEQARKEKQEQLLKSKTQNPNKKVNNEN
jgi:hypothetical protein